ncbi:hypothetical protein KEM56_006778 [Ascosphaera pollenicola]|nr:hypothetical protein KEM56_006778 [Ascosphaera pollenicola]
MRSYISQARLAYRPRVLYRLSTSASLATRAPLQHHLRLFSSSRSRCGLQDIQPGGVPSPNPVPDLEDGLDDDDDKKDKRKRAKHGDNKAPPHWKETVHRMIEAGATAFASIAVLGIAGYSYHKYYKNLVLRKIDTAFNPGDPVLDFVGEVPSLGEHWVGLEEQDIVNHIIDGTSVGHYFLLLGPKGVGKTSMIIDAMRRNQGDRVSMFEAHGDLEIFRIRLGKALDYEFHEDYIGSLFSIRGPRDTTALLDIERAFNKLEKLAVQRRTKDGKPLVLVINYCHLIKDDEDGQNLLELIQQRAESWAASQLVTVVLNSDDYWVYERLKNHANRLHVVPIGDLPKCHSLEALKDYRKKYWGENCSPELLEKIYEKVGGRITFLDRVAKSKDMLAACDRVKETEKTWFLNKAWILGSEMDDDVMDQQKWASAAMVLAKALVDKEKESSQSYDPEKGHDLVSIPLHKAREVMTRADFIHSYDSENLFYIDSDAMVRADSVPMMQAFREICAEPGFDQFLEDTLDRISGIESLGRTRELTVKDFWDGGKFRVITRDKDGNEAGTVEIGVLEKPEEEDGNDGGEEGAKEEEDTEKKMPQQETPELQALFSAKKQVLDRKE